MTQKSNVIVYLLSMLGGALTAILLIIFLCLLDILESSASNITTSILLIVVAIALSRTISKPFIDAISITFFLAGCIIPAFANVSYYPLVIISVGIAVFFFSKSFILSSLAVMLFNLGVCLHLSKFFWYESSLWILTIPIVLSFLIINLWREKLQISLPKVFLNYKSLHTGLFVSIVAVLGAMSLYHSSNWYLSPVIWICFLIVVHRIIQTMEVKSPVSQCCLYIASLAVLTPTLYAPYLSGSLLLIFLCFHYRYMKEFTISILLLIYTVSKYYYDMNFTLLTKSILLFSTGVVFLITWSLLTQKKEKS